MSILAWHFLPADGCLAHRKKRSKVKAGDTCVHRGPLELCKAGLHASTDILDALRYASGPILCRVEMSGKVLEGDDKLVATRRKVVWLLNIETVLHEFDCRCAERALLRERAAGREPDPRSWAAIEAKRAWLLGDCSDEDLDAAARATADAWAAARATARAAAGAWTAAEERDWRRTTLLALVEERRNEVRGLK